METRREIKSDKTLKDLAARIGITLLNYERRAEQMGDEGLVVTGMSIRMPNEDKPDYLVTVRAQGESAKVVAFSGGVSLAEVVRGTLERLYNRSMKWREDEY